MRVQIAALSSVALLTVELWPHAFAFASDLAKLIGITIAECCAVAAFDVVYLWRLWHDDVPDAYQLLPSVLHAGVSGTRWAASVDGGRTRRWQRQRQPPPRLLPIHLVPGRPAAPQWRPV